MKGTWTALLTLATTLAALAQQDVDTSRNNATIVPWRLFGIEAVDPGKCDENTPCVIEACCNGEWCGYSEEFCGKDVCISQCDAKAACGPYADPKDKECPLNVCCGETHACGTTESFCGDGCQTNCEQPGPGNPSSGDVRELVIGYFESWKLNAPDSDCSKREISDIRFDSLTHINVAFGYIKPSTYEVHPIEDASVAGFNSITALKQHAPGLQVWLSLGGWTFSDNDTVTQPVFGDLSSNADKRYKFYVQLEKFMLQWGFDGVDIDWEYPAAPDRRGKPQDTENYVQLLRGMKDYFATMGHNWGISFAAPASYWYLRHFNIEDMMPHVNWVNLMTYDLHGSWDQDSDWIGPHIYAHTNLTEIKEALNLLWRNSVPSNQVNLGLGFYGRSYELEDRKCYKPGCRFKREGKKGPCSKTEGYMSYQDIKEKLDGDDIDKYHDEEAGVEYMVYDNIHWVSYDSVDSIKQKVEFANENGLLGLFIWAVDQDTTDHELLDAVLWPHGLGKFTDQNGAGNDGSSWQTQPITNCHWSDCGYGCSGPYQSVTSVECDLTADEDRKKQYLCCPFTELPDSSSCRWSYPASNVGSICGRAVGCRSDEVAIATNDHYYDRDDVAEVCLIGGPAYYCCDAEISGPQLCRWESECISLNDNEEPEQGNPCREGSKFITYRKGDCGGESDENSWQAFCCDEDVEDPGCRWLDGEKTECPSACDNGEIWMGDHYLGGGEQCSYWDPTGVWSNDYSGKEDRKLCCDSNALSVKIKKLPVPLDHLWSEAELGPDTDKQDWVLTVDDGRNILAPDYSRDPDDHAFGWHIVSGPESKVTTLNKRDGSDWEVFDCEQTLHEGRQSAKMVCGSTSEKNNCHVIWKGQVERTIVEMPPGCGPGKYAMAVGLDAIGNVETHSDHRLVKRLNLPPSQTVYNLTFDYNFAVLKGRADSEDVLFRLDYSNDPGYWEDVVAAEPEDRRRKRSDYDEIASIVRRDFEGSWKTYADHEWRRERRNTPEDELHILHKKWFSQEVADWVSMQRKISYEANVLSHGINKRFHVDILDVKNQCPIDWLPEQVDDDIGAKISALLDVNVQTSTMISLKGDLAHLDELEAYLTFRNKGNIRASLTFDAWAILRIPKIERTLFGIAPIGASFKVPGVVTVGPEFKVAASIEGSMSLHADATIQFHVISWDYAQTFPLDGAESPINADEHKTGEDGANSGDVDLSWEVQVEGEVTAHIIPIVSFGIVFDPEWAVPNAAVELGLDAYSQLYGEATAGDASDGIEWCYGADAGYDLFARVQSPRLFGVDLNRRWSLANGVMNIFGESNTDKTCGLAGTLS